MPGNYSPLPTSAPLDRYDQRPHAHSIRPTSTTAKTLKNKRKTRLGMTRDTSPMLAVARWRKIKESFDIFFKLQCLIEKEEGFISIERERVVGDT